MPNRILKESIKTSPQIDKLTWFEEVLFYRLLVTMDDYGCCDGRAVVLKSELFPTKEDLTRLDVENALHHLEAVGLIQRYTVKDRTYITSPTWENHQRIRNKRRKFPEPTAALDSNSLTIDSNLLTNDSNSPQIAARIQSNPIQSESNPNLNPNTNPKRKETASQFTPPAVWEVEEYVKEKNLKVDPLKFFDYYESNDWIIGKTKMKDWKAALRTWDRREKENEKKGKEALPDYYNADPVRDKEPKLATPEEIERVRALLMKGAKKE